MILIFKKINFLSVLIFKVLKGFFKYAIGRGNSNETHQALIELHCLTRGLSSFFLSKIYSWFRPIRTRNLEKPIGVLGDLTKDSENLIHVVDNLKKNGYHVFKNQLSPEIIDSLLDFTKKNKALLRPEDGSPINSPIKLAFFDLNDPQTVRYEYSDHDLILNPVIQKLMTDPSITAVARSYLQAEPLIDIVSMWWHTAYKAGPDSNAAQLYHFDLDRIKWLKYFFYLTDVTPDSGPHCFIQGTHKPFSIPKSILKKGYARIEDIQVKSYYTEKDIIEFSGPVGTIIAEDTIGLHKGKHVINGARLVFQLQFAIGMFGAPGFKPFQFKKSESGRLMDLKSHHPVLLSNINIVD